MAHSRLSRHAGLGAPGGGRDTAGHGHDTAGLARNTVEEACDTTRSVRAVWQGEDAAIQSLYRELGGPSVAIQKKELYRGGGGQLWVAIQCAMAAIRRSNEPRYGAGGCDTRCNAATWRAVHARQGLRSQYKFCIVTGKGLRHGLVSQHSAVTRRAKAHMRANAHVRAATRLRHGHDTTGHRLRYDPGRPRHGRA